MSFGAAATLLIVRVAPSARIERPAGRCGWRFIMFLDETIATGQVACGGLQAGAYGVRAQQRGYRNVAANSIDAAITVATVGASAYAASRAAPHTAGLADDAVTTGARATGHGAERLAQAGFTDDLIAQTRAGFITRQTDGATVFAREVSPGRFSSTSSSKASGEL